MTFLVYFAENEELIFRQLATLRVGGFELFGVLSPELDAFGRVVGEPRGLEAHQNLCAMRIWVVHSYMKDARFFVVEGAYEQAWTNFE